MDGAYELLSKSIADNSANVAFVGLGQAGLPSAVTAARAGYEVTGYDINDIRVKAIMDCQSYSEDVSNEELRELCDSGRLKAESNLTNIDGANIVVIAVPTYMTDHNCPDLRAVKKVADQIITSLKNPKLIVLESTVYPGATERLIKAGLDKAGFKLDADYFLAYSPSRIDPGNKSWTLQTIPRLVGGQSNKSLKLALSFYGNIVNEVIAASSIMAAELTKLYENSYRAINIAFADKMHMLCRMMGLDAWEIIKLASSKPFGFTPFYPGPGIGGECIPVVPLFLAWKVKEFGARDDFIELASEINDQMPEYFVRELSDLLNKEGKALSNSKILLIGISYKKDVADLRESPALDIIELLSKQGADISYHDPLVSAVKNNGSSMRSIELRADLVKEQDATMIITDHSGVDYDLIADHSRLILDTRNVFAGYDRPHIYR